MLSAYCLWDTGFIIGFFFIVVYGRYLIKGTTRQEPRANDDPKIQVSNNRPNRSELYTTAVQMLMHVDNLTWSRMYNFLTANSLLMLAWATVFGGTAPPEKVWVLILISLAGTLLSLSWAAFNSRARRLQWQYVIVARQLEGHVDVSKDTIGPLQAEPELFKFLPIERWFGSRYLSIWVPLGLAIVFYALLLISLFQTRNIL